jgi:UDP-glucose 4-epimerase
MSVSFCWREVMKLSGSIISTIFMTFGRTKFARVVHLAAQAGVRYSLENPHAYVDSNVVGTLHVLEGCRKQELEHLVYASTSSVYGANTNMPFSVHHNVDHPLSLYAAQPPDCDFLLFTVRMVDRIWRCFCSPRLSWLENRSMFSITAITGGILPTWMIFPRA